MHFTDLGKGNILRRPLNLTIQYLHATSIDGISCFSIVIGAVGAALACFGIPFFDWLHIDDPVGNKLCYFVNNYRIQLIKHFIITGASAVHGKNPEKSGES